MDFSFTGKLAEAKTAETLAEQFLKNQRGVKRVLDVREDKAWQWRDVDYRVEMAKDMMINVEVKHDRHITSSGNVLFELCHIFYDAEPDRRIRPGWSIFSRADVVLVWCPLSATLYSFKTIQLRDGMLRYVKHCRGTVSTNIVSTNKQTWSTVNLLVPLRFVPHHKYRFMTGIWQEIA